MIGYAHIQLWPNHRAALRIIVIDESYRNHGLGAFHCLYRKGLRTSGLRVGLHSDILITY